MQTHSRFLLALLGVVIVFIGAYLLLHVDFDRLPRGGMTVKLYYYDPALDQGPGGVACSEKGLVAVERTIPRSSNPVRDTVHLLIEGRLTNEERDRGITTEFPLTELSLQSAEVRDSVATLIFLDPKGQTVGGSCRVSVLRAQIEATAKQFPFVRAVRLSPPELFEP